MRLNLEIKQMAHDFTEEIYKRGYEHGKEESITKEKAIDFLEAIGWQGAHDEEMIEHGMNIAWECIRKIVSVLKISEVEDIFGTQHVYDVVKYYSPSKAIQKIEDYEERQKQKDDEIHVGDEVCVNDDCKAIVIGISTLEGWTDPYNILFENGNTDWVRKNVISKTGKHYDAIDEMLKELRRDEE